MTLIVSLPPDLEARLVAEAARVGVTPEHLAAEVLDRHLPADRRTAAMALLDAWLAEAQADPSEQKATGEALIKGLDEGRPGQRAHFPPELEGQTW